MPSFENNKTFLYFYTIPICILLALSPLTACSSPVHTPTQPATTLPSTQPDKTSIPVPISTLAPSNTPLPDQQTIAPIVTHEGISIALTWVYADYARIGIEYRIRGVKLPEGYRIYCPVSAVILHDDTGNEYEKYIWPPPTEPSENFEFHCKQDETGNDYIVTQNYYGAPPDQSQSLALTLDIDLGGFDIFSTNGPTQVFPYFGPYTFNFEIPIIGSLTLEPDLIQSKNGMVVTLSRLVINPAVTDAFLCISYDNHKGWYPDMTLTWQGITYSADETSIKRTDIYHKTFPTYISQFTTERCYRYSFFLPYQANSMDQSPRQMIISLKKMLIDATDALTQEDCSEALKAAQLSYPDLVFSCDIDTSDYGIGVGFNIDKLPAGMDFGTAVGIANESLKSMVDGPFDFVVSVP